MKTLQFKQTEHALQSAVMKWAALSRCQYPELDLLFAIPNGGKRHPAVAKKLKAEGVKAGVPDLFLPVARGGWHGLFIELKVGRNKLSEAQEKWHQWLDDEQYKVAICRSFDEVVNEIAEYLNQI